MAESGNLQTCCEDAEKRELREHINRLNSQLCKMEQELSMAKAAQDVAESQVEDLTRTKEIMAAKLEMVYLIFGRGG